jgi:hypothetical protein
VARAARVRGLAVSAVAFHGGGADAALEREVDALTWLHLGELERLVETFRRDGVSDAIMIGKVLKTQILGDLAALRPDARALGLLAKLRERNDDAILGAIADELAADGIVLRSQTDLVPELVAREGVLGGVAPTAAQRAEIAFGFRIAKTLGAIDVGQTVVVRERAVLALEAIEGTDAAIRRGAALGGPGVCVVKVAKPRQDPRFDVPVVGPDTLAVLVEVKASVLAVEAGRTLVLDGEELVHRADRAGIALVGVVAPEVAP